jgi:hypothetical protein
MCVYVVQSDQRPQRCTGVALSVAVGLLESSFPRQVRPPPPHTTTIASTCTTCRTTRSLGHNLPARL